MRYARSFRHGLIGTLIFLALLIIGIESCVYRLEQCMDANAFSVKDKFVQEMAK